MGPSVTGLVKDRIGQPRTNDDGRPGGFYVPRFRNLSERHPNFIRAYGFEGGSGTTMFPGNAHDTPGFGAAYKKQVREHAGAFISMGGFGEVLPRYENQVDLDPVMKDKWGIPVLRFNYRFGDNEKKMCQDMAETAQEMFERAGFEIVSVDRTVLTEGWSIHELGTARMGTDRKIVRPEPVPAVARRQQPVRRGRQQPRQRLVPEPHVDHHGAGLALVRLPGVGVQEGQPVSDDLTRRDAIKLAAAATLAASVDVPDALAAQAGATRDRRPRPSSPAPSSRWSTSSAR